MTEEAGEETFVLQMDRYERDNLLALLHLIFREKEGPPLANGDWAGQLYWKLAPEGYKESEHNPNIPPDMQVGIIKVWAKAVR